MLQSCWYFQSSGIQNQPLCQNFTILRWIVEQGLEQFFIASSGSHFFNSTDLEQYLFNVLVILKITFTQTLLRRILSFFFVAP